MKTVKASLEVEGSHFQKKQCQEVPLDFILHHLLGHFVTRMAPCEPQNQFLDGSGAVLKMMLKKGDAAKRSELREPDLVVA